MSDFGFYTKVSSNPEVVPEVGVGSTSELEIGRASAEVVTSGVSGDAATETSFGLEPPEPDEFSIRPGGPSQ